MLRFSRICMTFGRDTVAKASQTKVLGLTKCKSAHKVIIPILQNRGKSMSSQKNGDTQHVKAKEGFVEGDQYHANRPSYTEEAVASVLEEVEKARRNTTNSDSSISYDVLELGAGTGKLTEKIFPKLGKEIKYLATEPVNNFLEVLVSNNPGIECKQMLAHSTGLPDNSVRCVLAAQCFHWFADQRSITEIHRILAEGGRFVCVWNNKEFSVPWVKAIEDILTEYYDDTPRAITHDWRKEIAKFEGFTDQEVHILPGIHFEGQKEDMVNHFSSISVIAGLGEEEKSSVRQRMMHVLDNHIQTKDCTSFVLPFHTEIFSAVKR